MWLSVRGSEMRVRRGLSVAEWPTRDQQLWRAASETGALFDAHGAAAHWAAATRTQVENGYGLWLGFLAANGKLQPDVSPVVRVELANLNGYITELSKRLAPVSVASRVRDLAEALRVMVPGCDRSLVMRALRRLERDAKPSRDLRSRLVSPTDLFEAGIHRMDRLNQAEHTAPMLRAVHYADGLRIAMLAAKPVRLKNLVATRLGAHLVKIGPTYRWKFARHETKTGELIDAELPLRLNEYIERWVTHYRRELATDHSGNAMWVSLVGTPMERAAVYERVCIATEEELGRRINPHAFRAIVATGVAVAMPDKVELTPFLLDHRTDRTVAAHYNLAGSLSASEAYLKRLEARRRQALENRRGKG